LLKRFFFLFFALLAFTAVADDRSEAEANIKKGNEFLKNGDYQKAISRFEIALKLAPELSSPYAGIGFAYQGLNDCTRATEAFQSYLAKTPEGKLAPDVKSGLSECKAKIFCRFSITSNPAGAEVKINGEVVGKTPYENDELKAGDYQVSITVAGYNTYQFPLKAAAGKEYVIPEVVLQKEGDNSQPKTIYVDRPGDPLPPATKRTWVGVAANGTMLHSKGAGFLGAGADLVFLKQNEKGNNAKGMHFGMNAGVDASGLLFEAGALYRLTPYVSKLAKRARWDFTANAGLFFGGVTGAGLFARVSPGFLFPIGDSFQLGFRPFSFGIDNFRGNNGIATVQLLTLSLAKSF
jgi:hypothetical protein